MENTGLITNIILATITFFSLIVSIFALTTWKRQLKSQNELETARKILISLYKVKQKVRDLRNPYISPGEEYAAFISEKIKKKIGYYTIMN